MYDSGSSGRSFLDQKKHRKEAFIRWSAPPMDFFALNTDGASKGTPGLAGAGGVIRDNCGIFFKGFAAPLGICSAFKAELAAVEIGLEMAKAMGIQKLHLQLDNQACVEALKNPVTQRGECCHMLNNCYSLLNWEGWSVFVFHCYREWNKVADSLANLGVIQSDCVTYFDVPQSEIKLLLDEDIVGVALPRLVVS